MSDRCPDCNCMSLKVVGPDNGYGQQLYCDVCGYENDAREMEMEDMKRRVAMREDRRNRKKRNR